MAAQDTETARVIATRCIVGICHMQVCAVNDATDEEILAACNAQNPSGTSNGWSHVCRENSGGELWGEIAPVQCQSDPGRTHFLVAC